MKRTSIINHLIEVYRYRSYLEIGVDRPSENFDAIKCKFKVGVDPNGFASYTGTSDEFFSENKLRFDIVFIDGLHRDYQVTRDIENSLAVLNENGTIVLHDCLPISEQHQSEEYNGGIWAGTVWRSLAKLRMTRPDLVLDIVDTDWGCGILRRGVSTLFPAPPNLALDYDFLFYNMDTLFNIITVDEFCKKYSNAT